RQQMPTMESTNGTHNFGANSPRNSKQLVQQLDRQSIPGPQNWSRAAATIDMYFSPFLLQRGTKYVEFAIEIRRYHFNHHKLVTIIPDRAVLRVLDLPKYNDGTNDQRNGN